MISSALLYYNTLRHLKRSQITHRVYRKLRPRPRPSVPKVDVREARRNWIAGASRQQSLFGVNEFRLLNQEVIIDERGDWSDSSLDRLLLYNLHYFDDLQAQGANERLQIQTHLLDRWMADNPPGGSPGWEPYPTSLRIVNWIKWSLSGGDLSERQLRSLAIQADWLSKNLEFHLLGNHLFVNAKALFFASCFFSGSDADRWRAVSCGVLEIELTEQILDDGGQFELSPMYHCLALEDVCDLINVAGTYDQGRDFVDRQELPQLASRMLSWLASMSHPDGGISLFNDSAFQIAPEPDSLFAYAARLGIKTEATPPIRYLEDSGYARVETGNACLITDIGEVGPSYIPGHAHADTLSFELSLFGQRWLVDTGCSTYEPSAERLRQRGTGSHNTVQVDDEDSSEVWASFRVARRAQVFGQRVQEEPGTTRVSCSHDGFMRLPGRVTHKRIWQMDGDRLAITDELSGTFSSAESRLLLHPDVDARKDGDVLLLSRDGYVARLQLNGVNPSIERSTWHPEFGARIATRQIRLPFSNKVLRVEMDWSEN